MIHPEKYTPEELRLRKRRVNKQCKKYDINYDTYLNLFKEQNGVCAICQEPEKYRELLAVDHCHKTNKIRGLLCTKCNTSLGKLNDSVELLYRAIDYLQANKQITILPESKYNKNRNEYRAWRYIIITPDGKYPSAEHAAKFYGVHHTTIIRWVGKIKGAEKDRKEGWSTFKVMGSLLEIENLIKENNIDIFSLKEFSFKDINPKGVFITPWGIFSCIKHAREEATKCKKNNLPAFTNNATIRRVCMNNMVPLSKTTGPYEWRGKIPKDLGFDWKEKQNDI